jgi:hypothetical protein
MWPSYYLFSHSRIQFAYVKILLFVPFSTIIAISSITLCEEYYVHQVKLFPPIFFFLSFLLLYIHTIYIGN